MDPVGVGGMGLAALDHLFGQVCDAQHVLVGLGGQTQHEVELYAGPATGKGGAAGLHQVLLGDVLVDGVPKPLGPCLGSKGQPAFAHRLHPLHQAHGKVVRPQRGQRKANVPGAAVVQQSVT